MPKYISLEAAMELLQKEKDWDRSRAFDVHECGIIANAFGHAKQIIGELPAIEYPPCNIGDTIYTAFLDKVMQYTVNEIKITTSGTYIDVIGDFEKEFRISPENLGETFFLTYEEAEKHIKENKNNE